MTAKKMTAAQAKAAAKLAGEEAAALEEQAARELTYEPTPEELERQRDEIMTEVLEESRAWDPPHDQLNVYQAVNRVQRMIGAVGKSSQTEGKGEYKFAYRGIEALINALGPIIHEVGLNVSPTILDIHYEPMIGRTNEPNQYGRDQRSAMVHQHVQFRIRGPQGDVHEEPPDAWGFAPDNDGFGSGKSFSYAEKTALGTFFMIVTDAAQDTEQGFTGTNNENYDRGDFSRPSPRTQQKIDAAKPAVILNKDQLDAVMAEFGAIEDVEARKDLRAKWLELLAKPPHEHTDKELNDLTISARNAIEVHNTIIGTFDVIKDDTERAEAIAAWIETLPKPPLEMVMTKVATLESLGFSATKAAEYFAGEEAAAADELSRAEGNE